MPPCLKTVSVAGATVPDLYRYIMEYGEDRKDKYDAIYICIGTNHVETLDVFCVKIIHIQIDFLLQKLRQKFPLTPIIMLGILPRPKYTNWDQYQDTWQQQNRSKINKEIRTVVTKYEGTYYRNTRKVTIKNKTWSLRKRWPTPIQIWKRNAGNSHVKCCSKWPAQFNYVYEIITLDMEKAFDRINHKYLYQILDEILPNIKHNKINKKIKWQCHTNSRNNRKVYKCN